MIDDLGLMNESLPGQHSSLLAHPIINLKILPEGFAPSAFPFEADCSSTELRELGNW
jgi:hypothetical protein